MGIPDYADRSFKIDMVNKYAKERLHLDSFDSLFSRKSDSRIINVLLPVCLSEVKTTLNSDFRII